MPHVLWKGAIAFGLVHIPVTLHSGARRNNVDFDWIDRRDMQPVGYKRINKKTGREVPPDDIARGIDVGEGRYALMSDEEIASARAEKAHAIDISAFVAAESIGPEFFDTPYVLGPEQGADKVYALLRETLTRNGLVGIARIVIQTREHLAALLVRGPALVLNTLRWPDELRNFSDVKFPPADVKKLGLKSGELQMADRLVQQMRGDWQPDQYVDTFHEALTALVERKTRSGDTRALAAPEQAAPKEDADLSDLSALLRRSLGGPAAPEPSATPAAKPKPSAKPATRPKPSTKPAAKPKPAAARSRAA